jgi:hypothetical protein
MDTVKPHPIPKEALIGVGIVVVIIVVVLLYFFVFKSSEASPSSVATSPTGRSGTTPAPAGPPVNCVVSDWSNSGSCSKFCGPGKQTQRRTVITQAANGGTACPALTQQVDCYLRPCQNVDCEVSDWSPYSTTQCTSTNQNKTRTRTVVTPSVDYGAECPSLTESTKCTRVEVDTLCNFTPSVDRSKCSLKNNGKVGGEKTTSYTSTVSGCSKQSVKSDCTVADVEAGGADAMSPSSTSPSPYGTLSPSSTSPSPYGTLSPSSLIPSQDSCRYTRVTDKSNCTLMKGIAKGEKTASLKSTVAGCPEIPVELTIQEKYCTRADVKNPSS